jgi:hypothetical protein
MTIYNFPNHRKGDTFRSKQINLGFDITGANIMIQFKLDSSESPVFSWLTANNTISIVDALNGVITMNSRVLDHPAKSYVYDFQFTDISGNVTTYFGGAIKIIQDITT